ncbi:helix-turn-helix domain-containing protein [Microlunatus antarcticus]|uniref:Transcriptional regulator with XRE-family HTH domain n=1 Tax=Microlunatus antarcticus TaxID=53388 RepID=A0A7W5P6X3_9ACTN|nr:transcriptional regulator with XRE-family HTH domain [Microlunatus antarcticus]
MSPAGSRAPDLAALGERLRELRGDRGLSLSALAAAAGIGKGSLSEIEAGQRNPTLATLYALAGPLDVPLATLLADEPGTEVSADGLTATLLSTETTADGSTVEIYRLAFQPDADRRSPAHGPGVREHVLVTAGRLEVRHREGTAVLDPGDSVSFSSAGAHRYRPLDGEACSAVLVITSTR